MLKKRVGIWTIFLIICLVCQLVISVTPSVVVSIKQWSLDSKMESIIKEHEEAATEPPTEETQPSDGTDDGSGENAGQQAETQMFSTMIEIIANAARYLGIIVMIFGVFQIVLGFKDENPDATSRAVSMMVVGGVLMGFSMIVPTLLNGMSG